MIIKKASFQDWLDNDPLSKYFVPWNNLTIDNLNEYKDLLSKAICEQDLQTFFQNKPICLIQHLSGGHGRWVMPQKKLGSQFVADFIIGERNSDGFHWTLVELESPKHAMFNKNGDPRRQLIHAIRQINDWRSWLEQNRDYASRPEKANGLGLTDISTSARGLILIGRQRFQDDSSNALRRQMKKNENIDIHSYDFILRAIEGKLGPSFILPLESNE